MVFTFLTRVYFLAFVHRLLSDLAWSVSVIVDYKSKHVIFS